MMLLLLVTIVFKAGLTRCYLVKRKKKSNFPKSIGFKAPFNTTSFLLIVVLKTGITQLNVLINRWSWYLTDERRKNAHSSKLKLLNEMF